MNTMDAATACTRRFLTSPARLATPIVLIAAIVCCLDLLHIDAIPGHIGWPLMALFFAAFIVVIAYASRATEPGANPAAMSEPFRDNPNKLNYGFVAPAMLIPGVFLIDLVSSVADASSALSWAISAALGASVALILALPPAFGFIPWPTRLPDDFAARYPYSPDSPEAAVLAVLHTGGAPRRVAFADTLPYFTSLDDATLAAALENLQRDGLVKVQTNDSALTEKGRGRKLVELTAAAP
nr:hypothetical protein [Corynebacterium lactis]